MMTKLQQDLHREAQELASMKAGVEQLRSKQRELPAKLELNKHNVVTAQEDLSKSQQRMIRHFYIFLIVRRT
jgi:hypothetical protein